MNKLLEKLENRPALILLVFFIVSLCNYILIINAGPIWDDFYFIFDFAPFRNGQSYFDIWKYFAWPLSTSLFKFMLGVFGDHYFFYHLSNILIHAINSFLIYKIIKKLNLSYPLLTAGLFLIHPANIISVAWIIQIKTLFAFLLFMGTVWFYIESYSNRKLLNLIIAASFFLLSLLTKSSAILFPIIAIIAHLSFSRLNKKSLISFSLLFIIGLLGCFKILGSEVVKDRNSYGNFSSLDILFYKLNHSIQIIWYYIEQSIYPSNFIPVKGVFEIIGSMTMIGLLLFLMALIIMFFLLNKKIGLGFISALILMIPFMGIVTAPYMKLTSVSDQHLYFFLPILIWVFISLMNYVIDALIPSAHKKFIVASSLSFFISYFFSSTLFHSTNFKNEEVFYQRSIDYNPKQLMFYINLASYYQEHNDLDSAINTINSALEIANSYPELKEQEAFGLVGRKWFDIEVLKRKRNPIEKD